MRDGSADALEALSRQGRYQTVRDNLRVKEVRLERTPAKRWIVCHNPAEAMRDKTTRDAAIAPPRNRARHHHQGPSPGRGACEEDPPQDL